MMARLAFNYLKPLSIFIFLVVSIGIFVSYFVISSNTAHNLANFYHQYWHIIILLLAISVLLLLLAFCSPVDDVIYMVWIKHISAIILLALFAREIFLLIKIGDLIVILGG